MRLRDGEDPVILRDLAARIGEDRGNLILLMKTPHLFSVALLAVIASASAQSVDETLKKVDAKRGIVCLAGLPGDDPNFVTELAKASELQFYFQSADAEETKADAGGELHANSFPLRQVR